MARHLAATYNDMLIGGGGIDMVSYAIRRSIDEPAEFRADRYCGEGRHHCRE
jgi:hypothetical protein